MSSPRSVQIFSSLTQPLRFDSSGVSKQFKVVLLIVFPTFEDRRRFFSQSCSILFKIRDSILLPTSGNCFDRENSFHLSGAIQDSFQFDYSKAIISGLFILSFHLSFSNFTGVSLKWSLISLRSLRSLVSKFPQVSGVFSNSSWITASDEKKQKSTSNILRMVKKRISNKWNNPRG